MPRIRYFLVSFNPQDNSGKIAFGSIAFECEGFFSHSFLFDKIKNLNPDVISVVIINLYEFANEYDYKKYINNE